MDADNPAASDDGPDEIERIYGPVRRFFAFKLDRRDLVDDFTQEVIATYLTKRRAGERFENPRKYALGIARNVLLRHARAQHRGLLPFDSRRMSASRIFDSPSTRFDRRQQVLDALRSLPNDQQDIVIMRWLNGMTLEECSLALSVSVATIKRYQARAHRRIRRRLEPMLNGDVDKTQAVFRRVWQSV